eukprot:11205085-Lingulodinium_polyedra.AAC.1
MASGDGWGPAGACAKQIMPLHAGPPECFSAEDSAEHPGYSVLTCALCGKQATNSHCRGQGHLAKLKRELGVAASDNMQWP